MTQLTTLPTIKNEALRDSWEERALVVFRRAYIAQQRRITPALLEANRDEILSLINQLFVGEADQVAADVRRFMHELADDVSIAALVEAGVSADPDTLLLTINRLASETAKRFGGTMTETSQRLVYSITQDWLDTDASTIGELRNRYTRIWQGPRPVTAAVTETTRLVGDTRIASWQESGLVWGYHVDIRDINTRDSHRAVSEAGPYRLDDPTGRVPINGDPNCFCTVRPAVENPNE